MATPEPTNNEPERASVAQGPTRFGLRLSLALAVTALDLGLCAFSMSSDLASFPPAFLLLARGVLAGLMLVGWRSSAPKDEPLVAALPACLLVAGLPVFGGALVALGTSPLARPSPLEEAPRHLAWTSAVKWDNPNFKPRGPAHHDTPAAIGSILNDRQGTSPELRLQALMRLRPLVTRLQMRMARRALSDPSDEVRLFAFSMIDKLRATHERQLERAHAVLALASAATASPAAEARAHVQLAETLWESVYHGLYEDAAQRELCDETLRHIETAEELAPLEGSAELLRGRVFLLRREDSAADGAFCRALALGCPASRVLPYQAECAFRRRDFAQLRALLATLRRTNAQAGSLPPSFTPIMEHWL